MSDLLTHILSSSPAVLFSFEATGDYAPTFISDNIRNLLGYESAEYLKDPDFWRRRVHPDDAERIEAEFAQVFDNGHSSQEYRFLHKDGGYRWVRDEQHLIRDQNENPIEVVGSWSDVTAHKQVEEALVAAQERITRLVVSSPAVLYSFEASGDYSPTFISDNIKDLFGYDPSEYMENADFWRNSVHRDDLERVESEFSRLLRVGYLTLEYRFLHKDGTYRWVRDEQHLIRGKTGEPVEVVGSWSDISVRKRLEQETEAIQARLQFLITASPAVIYSFEATGDYAPTFISENFKDLLGYEPREYLETADFWQRNVHPEDVSRVLGAIPRLFEEGQLSHEYRFLRKDGAYCWISDDLRLMCDDTGRPIEVVGAWSDITSRKRMGEAVVKAQNRLLHVLSSSPVVIYSFEATGDFAPTFISENVQDVFGYEPREYLETADFWRRRVHPDDLERVETNFSRLLQTGEIIEEYRFLHKDGTHRWVSDEQRLISDKEGNPIEIVGSWGDVTARKQAEDALAETEQRLSDAIETIPEGFSLYDANDRLVLCNKKYGELLYPGAGMPQPGTTFEQILRDAVERGLIESAKDDMETWIASRLAKRREPGGTLLQRRADGRWIQVSERRTQDGGTVAVYTDISDIKRAEEALHEKTEFLRLNQVITRAANEAKTVDEALRVALLEVCTHARWPVGHVYLRAEEATEELEPTRLWHFDDAARFETFRKVTESTRFTSGIGLPGRVLASGKPAWIRDVTKDANFPRAKMATEIGVKGGFAFPVLVGREVVAVLEFFSEEAAEPHELLLDVMAQVGTQLGRVIERTRGEDQLRIAKDEAERALVELKQTQESLIQAEKMASLGQLTAGIAHEIKNPLNFVNNFAEVSGELLEELKETLNPLVAGVEEAERGDARELFDTLSGNLTKIKEHGARADRIVKSMLSHAREAPSTVHRTDLNALIEESLNLAYHSARAEDQSFNVTLEREFDPEVGELDVFPQEISRVFLNLISNGFYAMHKRRMEWAEAEYRPTLKVSTREIGEAVEVRVRDNGTGMSAAVLEKLFTPFFTTKPTGAGTGLGLSLSYDIVAQQHHGQFDVDSREGEFSEFIVTLPRKVTEANATERST